MPQFVFRVWKVVEIHGIVYNSRKPTEKGSVKGSDLLMKTRQFSAFLFFLAMAACQGHDCHGRAQPSANDSFQHGVLIELRGIVSPRMEMYLQRKLEQARTVQEDLLILEIDSPGGYLESSLNMAARMRDLEWARTICYVPRQALSGAAIIALGCDEIVMADHARLGDAGPIFQGEDALFRYAPEKIRSDLARQVRDLAAAKGRPPALAEAMVDKDLAVYRVTERKTGKVTYMTEHEIQDLEDPQTWIQGKLVMESRQDKFLEVNGKRAVALQLATAILPDRQALSAHYRLARPLVVLQPSGVDAAVYYLSLPVITGLLFVVGLIALFVEVSAPGIGLGGLVSGLCFTLFFWSRFLGGTAGWLEVVLFLAGLVFLAIELFVLPGFGVFGVASLLLLLASIVMAGQNHFLPESQRALDELTNTMKIVVLAGFCVMLGVGVITRYYGSIPIFRRLALQPPVETHEVLQDEQGNPLATAGDTFLQIGARGVAQSPLRPAGKGKFASHLVDVVTEGQFVERGQPVQIVQIEGNRIVVREIDQA